eukprot:1154872-Pelagomonas_calceolata.AAC.2
MEQTCQNKQQATALVRRPSFELLTSNKFGRWQSCRECTIERCADVVNKFLMGFQWPLQSWRFNLSSPHQPRFKGLHPRAGFQQAGAVHDSTRPSSRWYL